MNHPITPAENLMAQLRAVGLPEHLSRGQFMVYRFKDSAGHLLYVGVTCSPRARWQAHKNRAKWWPRVASVSVEWHPTEYQALDSEVAAIRSEQPLFNVRSAVAFS